jgi:hypothetical protein
LGVRDGTRRLAEEHDRKGEVEIDQTMIGTVPPSALHAAPVT